MNLLDKHFRVQILQAIDSNDNKGRRGNSFKHQEVYNERLKQYVHENLLEQFDKKTVDEMPVISCINTYKRVVDNIATVYSTAPQRDFEGLTDDQKETAKAIYKDSKFNSKLKLANKILVSPGQAAVMVIPKDGQYLMRVIRPHNYSVIPDPDNPEEAFAYIISSFDKWRWQDFDIDGSATGFTPESELHQLEDDNNNELIADKEDYKSQIRHTVWSKDFNFIMDGNGDVIDPETDKPMVTVTEADVLSPLAEQRIIPIYDLFRGEKDSEFFIRSGHSLFDFTVQFNAAMTDVNQIVRMNGWSQAYLKGPKGLLPQNITVGPTKVLLLEQDPENPDITTEFGFASTGSDVSGSIQFLETFLFIFLSSRGVDPKIISTSGDSTTYSSGVERLLAMIDKMQASMEDYEKMEELEAWIYKIIKAWNEAQPELVDKKYQLGTVPEESSVSVTYKDIENVQTQKEQNENAQQEIEMGIKSRVEEVMERRKVARNEAVEILRQIDEDEGLVNANPQEEN